MVESLTFFKSEANISVSRIAQECGCTLRENDNEDLVISVAGPIEAAFPGSLTFIDNPKYMAALQSTKAGAVICAARNVDMVPKSVVALIADNPYQSFARAMALLFPAAMRPQPVFEAGVSSAAHIHPTASIEEGATVEPGAVVGAGAAIGKGSLIGPNAVIGNGVQIGRDTSICAGATVLNALVGNNVIIHCGVRLGSDGFGFAMGPGGHRKIPQIGRVVIQDNVEIGANTCVDRGSNRDTVIGEGTKIDNLVMIGHNVVIGRHCVIVGQTGIAGSSELGDYVVLGGQAAINGHVKIGSGSQIAGLSGVSADVPPGVQWGGVPARPIKLWMRDIARIRREAAQWEKNKGKQGK